jgi:sugar lactone lactonase YvrE
VYGGAVTLCLGGRRLVEIRSINTPGVRSEGNGVAVSRDGCTLLVADCWGGSHAIHAFNAADGSRRRTVGGYGSRQLQFNAPGQVWLAPDGFVFVAECSNHRVQVLTPRLDFHAFVGVGHVRHPTGVCANADIVVVLENVGRIAVFSRCDGALLRVFGSGQLVNPNGLCFMSGDRHVAVADSSNARVSVFSVDGEFIRHVGVGVLMHPVSVACCAFDELVVADTMLSVVVMFSSTGEVAMTTRRGNFLGVAVHDGAVFSHDNREQRCVVFG